MLTANSKIIMLDSRRVCTKFKIGSSYNYGVLVLSDIDWQWPENSRWSHLWTNQFLARRLQHLDGLGATVMRFLFLFSTKQPWTSVRHSGKMDRTGNTITRGKPINVNINSMYSICPCQRNLQSKDNHWNNIVYVHLALYRFPLKLFSCVQSWFYGDAVKPVHEDYVNIPYCAEWMHVLDKWTPPPNFWIVS